MSKKEIMNYEIPEDGLPLIERAKVGDWYWITIEDVVHDYNKQEDIITGTHEELMCISHIGSNHFVFEKSDECGSDEVQVHFNEFEKDCREETNWKKHINQRMQRIQEEMKEAMAKMLEEGHSLALITEKGNSRASQSQSQTQTTLPAIATKSPKKHQQDLIAFQEKMPQIQKKIEELAKDFAITAKDLALPDLIKMKKANKALGIVKDRIFNLELYCGLQEEVHKIADGNAAPIDTPVHIMQQLLYMDEECLFDFKSGGMDYSSLSEWDEWVVSPENLNRLAPHPRCIVGFRVRRHTKERENATSLASLWVQICEEIADMETYLLIRNGDKVYRIASAVDFSPRLVPKKDEIGEAQFLKVHRQYNGFNRADKVTEEKIGPEHLDYDEHVEKLDNDIKHYNRIIILLQGIFDRTDMFMPHVGVKLTKSSHMEKWVKAVRDEEMGLPNNAVTWEEYRIRMNKSIKKGKKVWSKWFPDSYGKYPSWDSNYKHYTMLESEIINRPEVCEITAIKRDKSEVRISFKAERYVYGGWRQGEYHEGGERKVNRTLWIPIKNVFNVSDYTIGDYKMFLCDRSLRGEYLKWANQLLTAEELARKGSE